ncbi:MAG: AraC family transcriptional regulator [Bacteroidales bacterium]|nr:AraC family transcriptional regulator [Bacteroidales bacterium]
MQKVSLKDFSPVENIDYNNGDILIMSDISELPRKDKELLLDMVTVVICRQGQISVSIEGRLHHLTANKVLILSPNTFVDSYLASDDADVTLLCFSLQPLENNLMLNKTMIRSRLFIKQHPVLEITDDYREEMALFYSIVPVIKGKEKKKYHKEIVESLRRCLAYMYLSIVEQQMEGMIANDSIADKQELLFADFLDLLEKNQGKLRKINDIASLLNISPKYLSSSIKKASGKNAQYWVHMTCIKAIQHKLKYSNKSIKEISFEMGFPDLSFFGKFFKTQTGMSPKEYRQKLVQTP